jgi:hypothetical protein
VGGDGTLYPTTRGGILAVRGGTVAPVLAPHELGDDTVAGKPFEREAPAGELGVDLAGPQRPDLAVDPAGDLYLAQQELEDDVPEGFRWTGELGAAGSLARSLFDGTVRSRVRRITTDGEVGTAAWAAGEVPRPATGCTWRRWPATAAPWSSASARRADDQLGSSWAPLKPPCSWNQPSSTAATTAGSWSHSL